MVGETIRTRRTRDWDRPCGVFTRPSSPASRAHSEKEVKAYLSNVGFINVVSVHPTAP